MAARRKSGFTLIELLVVIAIIAILAAILFPVFARARETARKSTCSSNMHECGLALQTYWNDYDATLPGSRTSGAADAQAFCTGTGNPALPPPPPTTAVPNSRVSWAQMIYDYVKSRDICFCPSDSSKEAYVSLSYWWKTAANDAWWGTTTGGNACKKESDFGYTADQIILYEHQGFHSSENVLKNGVQINVAFLDTHVRNINLKDSAAPANATVYPDPAGATSTAAAGEPMYYNWNMETDVALGSARNGDPRKMGDKL